VRVAHAKVYWKVLTNTIMNLRVHEQLSEYGLLEKNCSMD
jgi:hypothetical protein